MPGSRGLKALAASMLVCGAVGSTGASASDGDIFLGVQLGGSSLSAEAQGPGAALSNFDHGTTFSGSVLAAYERSHRGRDYRITGTVSHSEWTNARSLETLAGVDLLWPHPDGSGAVYFGPRLGIANFNDDITNNSNTRFAWGAEFGTFTNLAEGPEVNARPVSAGFFVRHTVIDARQSGVIGNGIGRDIKVSSQTMFGFQMLLPFQ